VMMKWARTLYDIARGLYLDRDDIYKGYVSDCARLVQKILEFDPDNHDGVTLLNSLHQTFGFNLGEGGSAGEAG
jgi:hypothetical protein